MTCTIEEAKRRISNKLDWENGESESIILWGAPGLGKSQMIVSLVCEKMIQDLESKTLQEIKDNNWAEDSKEFKKAAEELAIKKKILDFDDITHELLDLISPHLLVIRLAERPIEQLQGVVVPSLSADYARFVMPENIAKIKNSPWGLIFLDELDKASESKFGAATHILENKVIGDFHLPKGWAVIAACNREEDSFLANPVPPELRNRAANIEIELSPNVWLKWAAKKHIRPDLILFHKSNHGEWLAKYDLEQTYAFPTPRTWTKASRAIDKLENKFTPKTFDEKIKFYDEVVRFELEDFVGQEAASAYYTYRKLYLEYPIAEILNGTKRIPKFDGSTNSNSVISEQCTAAFAVADQLTPDLLKPKNVSVQEHKRLMGNLVLFMTDLTPEIRTIYLAAIHKTRILNMIMDSGQAESLIEDMVEYIASS